MFSIVLVAATCLMQPSIDLSTTAVADNLAAIRKLKMTVEFVELDIRNSVPPAKEHGEKEPMFDYPKVSDFRDLQELVKKSKVRTHRTLSGDIELGSPIELKIKDHCLTFSAGGAVFQRKDHFSTLPIDDKIVYLDVRIHWLARFSHFVPIPGQAAPLTSKPDAEIDEELLLGKPVLLNTKTASWEMSGKEWMHVYSAIVLRVDDVK